MSACSYPKQVDVSYPRSAYIVSQRLVARLLPDFRSRDGCTLSDGCVEDDQNCRPAVLLYGLESGGSKVSRGQMRALTFFGTGRSLRQF